MIVKVDELEKYIVEARKSNPRAYEPWSTFEDNLLKEALVKTNDLKILSECFGRSNSSIKTRVGIINENLSNNKETPYSYQ